MKIALKILCIACGLYLFYEGYSTYTFSARSPDGNMGIMFLEIHNSRMLHFDRAV